MRCGQSELKIFTFPSDDEIQGSGLYTKLFMGASIMFITPLT